AGGCANTTTVEITDPPALTITPLTITNVGCNGESNGALEVDVNGGTQPYDFRWSNGETVEDLFNIPAGTYTLTVTDTQGCVTTFTQEITQPSRIDSLITGTTLNVTNVSCNGLSNGAVSVSISGGTPPYDYFWSDGSTDSSLTNLTAGPLEVLIRDANGCSSTATVTITEPQELLAVIQNISVYAGGYNITCPGATDGFIDLDVSGGTPQYSYSWSNGDTTQDLSGLTEGLYSVLVTDANGCPASVGASLFEPAPVTAFLTSPTYNGYNIPCKGDTSGIIYSDVLNGAGPYTWNWSTGSTADTIAYLPAGTYSVTVTDANGCTTQDSITLTEPNFLTPRIEATVVAGNFNIGCNGDSTGTAWVEVTGGTSPFSFLWSNGFTEDTLTNLPAGTLWVVVRDTNFCFGTDTAFLNQPDPITAFVSVSADASCNGNADGQASATVFGGTPGYSYSWSNGDTTNTLQLASAGTYYLTVTDANNCIYQDSIEISQPDVLSASAVASVFPSGDNISCNGASDGSIDLTVAGGTLPFTFVWSNNEQTEDISNLPPGTYTVDITDINGCSTQAVATLTEPTPLTVDTIFSPEYFGGWNVSCNGGTNGAVNIDVSGGSPGYTYYWSNGDTTQDISNVSVFIYYVTVTDVNGCIAQDSLLIDEPTLLDANVSAQTNVDCFGSSTGTITVAASGSTAPYQYSIDNGPFGSSF
ncbi:MAG: SprB repeat-containing protein, partial [Bacteroidota bacterium]